MLYSAGAGVPPEAMCESSSSSANVLTETVHILANACLPPHVEENRFSDEEDSSNPKLTFGIDRLLSQDRTDDRRQQEYLQVHSPPPYQCANVQLYANQSSKTSTSGSEFCEECKECCGADKPMKDLFVDPAASKIDQFFGKSANEVAYQTNSNECSGDLQLSGPVEDYNAYGLISGEYDRRVPKLILKPLPVRVAHGSLGCTIFNQQSRGLLASFPHGSTTAYLGPTPFESISPFGIDGHDSSANNPLLPTTAEICGKSHPSDFAANNRVTAGQSSISRRKRSWSRAVFSTLQRKGLERTFQEQKYITKPDRKRLAANLGLHDAQVKVWFQNRRMKWRHTVKNSQLLASPQKQPEKRPPSNDTRSKDFGNSVADLLTLSINEDSEDIEVIID